MSSESFGPASEEPSPGDIPPELPPVTPPSAGFILQLFLIPALIVAAVIAVWGLFGQLASSEVDLDRLIIELGNNNEHRRWRAAHNLYVLLQNERHTDQNDPARLSVRRDVAEGLTNLLNDSLDSPDTDDPDVLNHQVFLARTMGSLQSEDIVLPCVARAMNARLDPLVRRSALMSLALISARHFAQRTGISVLPSNTAIPDLSPLKTDVPLPLSGPSIGNEEILSELTSAAQDADASIRHLAAYILGLISGPDAMNQLNVLLLDGDQFTQVNAAVALSRNADTSGIPTILRILRKGSTEVRSKQIDSTQQPYVQTGQPFDQSSALVVCVTAVCKLWNLLDDDDKTELRAAIVRLRDGHASPGIRMHAKAALREIR